MTPRFFCPAPLPENTRIRLPEALSHHAVRVLRLKAGSPIVLFNGQGGQVSGTLDIEGKQGFAQLGQHQAIDVELAGRITLVQGMASSDKMDWIVEKAVELGACHLVPIAARRSVLQLSGERLEKRMAHWQRIIESASEQCGRNRLMALSPAHKLADFLEQHTRQNPEETLLLCHPGAERNLVEALAVAGIPEQTNKVTILVGPEGGWSEEELEQAQNHGITPVRFGERILRTETAGSALITAISALCGWI